MLKRAVNENLSTCWPKHTHTNTLTHTVTVTHKFAQSTGIHAHRKVLIGCCPALHDAIYWLRVQYPVARDNIACTVLERVNREREGGKGNGAGAERQTDRQTERLTEKRAYVVYAVAFWMPGQNAFGPLPFDGIRHRSAVRGASHRHELEPPCHMPHGATHRDRDRQSDMAHGLYTATELGPLGQLKQLPQLLPQKA